MTNNKMTNRAALSYVIDNCAMPDEVRAKLVAMLDAAEKKATTPRKPSAKAIENEAAATALYPYLSTDPKSIEMLISECPEIASFSTHRVAAIIGKLVSDGRAKRESIKGKVHYSVNA